MRFSHDQHGICSVLCTSMSRLLPQENRGSQTYRGAENARLCLLQKGSLAAGLACQGFPGTIKSWGGSSSLTPAEGFGSEQAAIWPTLPDGRDAQTGRVCPPVQEATYAGSAEGSVRAAWSLTWESPTAWNGTLPHTNLKIRGQTMHFATILHTIKQGSGTRGLACTPQRPSTAHEWRPNK